MGDGGREVDPVPRASRTAGAAGESGRGVRWGWAAPALLTLVVTLTGVGRAQLWRDELATWSAATRSVPELARMVGTIDAATGPYYLLMHGWVTAFGESPTALRLPSVLAMTGAAGLTTVLGQRWYGIRVGLFAGLLFAVLPGTSRYGQEARPYAITTFLSVLATLLLVAALHRPGWWRWTAYAVVVAALGMAHLVAVTLVVAHGVLVLPNRRTRTAGPAGRRGWRPVWCWLVSLLPAAALLVPVVLLARGQRSRQLDWVDVARLGDLATLPTGLVQSGTVGGLLLGLAALGVARLGRRARSPGVCLLLPVLLLFLAGLVVPLWVPRYLLFTVPFACLLAGTALAGVVLRAGLAVVLLAGLVGLPDQIALRRTHEWPRSAPIDYRAAAGIIAAHQRPGDAIVYGSRSGWALTDVAVRYYLDGRAPRDVLASRTAVQRGSLWAEECPDPARCLAGVARVWLVLTGRQSTPLPAVRGPTGAALRASYRVEQVWTPSGLTVALLDRTAG